MRKYWIRRPSKAGCYLRPSSSFQKSALLPHSSSFSSCLACPFHNPQSVLKKLQQTKQQQQQIFSISANSQPYNILFFYRNRMLDIILLSCCVSSSWEESMLWEDAGGWQLVPTGCAVSPRELQWHLLARPKEHGLSQNLPHCHKFMIRNNEENTFSHMYCSLIQKYSIWRERKRQSLYLYPCLNEFHFKNQLKPRKKAVIFLLYDIQ